MKEPEIEKLARYFNDESDYKEKKEIEVWLQDPQNKREFEKLKKIWKASGDVYKNYSPNLVKAWQNIESGISDAEDTPTKSIDAWKWISRVAAALVLAVGIGWMVMQFGTQSDTPLASLQEFNTSQHIDSVLLSDGSIVWLNRNSSLRFPENFGTDERKIILEGEAFFEVKRDTQRPFIVEAQGTVTRVLGTSFNIDARNKEASVAVFTGKVSFSESNDQENYALLTRGEKAIINPETNQIIKSAVDPNALAWKTGVLTFQNTKLSKVVETLSDHYGTDVSLAFSDSLSLTTSFEKQSLEEVLEVICMTLDLQYQQTSEGYLIKNKPNN